MNIIIKEFNYIFYIYKIFAITAFSYESNRQIFLKNNQLIFYKYFISIILHVITIFYILYLFKTFSISHLHMASETGNFASMLAVFTTIISWSLINIQCLCKNDKQILILNQMHLIDIKIQNHLLCEQLKYNKIHYQFSILCFISFHFIISVRYIYLSIFEIYTNILLSIFSLLNSLYFTLIII